MAWYVPLIIEGVRMIAEHNADKGPSKYKRTPEEQKYIDRLQKRSKYGTIDTGEVIRQTGRELHVQAADQKQEIIGRGITSGNMSSIITEELFRGVDKSVRDQINESSRQIALKNEEAKIFAQDSLDEFLVNEGSARRTRNEEIRAHGIQKEMKLIGNLAEFGKEWHTARTSPGGPGYEKSLTATRKRGSAKGTGLHANYYNVKGGGGYYKPGGAGHSSTTKYKPFQYQAITNFINNAGTNPAYFDDVDNYKSLMYQIDSSFAKTIDWTMPSSQLLPILKNHVNTWIDTGNTQGGWGLKTI